MTMEKYPGESVPFDLDCSDMLAASVTITGTPALSFLPALTGGDGLTFGSATVNTQAVTYADGRTAAAGKVIQVRIAGGSAPANQTKRAYSVIATFTDSNGDTQVARALLDVLNPAPSV